MTGVITFKEDPRKGSLGLEKEARSKMPNCVDIIQPGKGIDGRWATNLDELSVTISRITDSKERKKKFDEVKAEREQLEALLNQDLSGTSKYWEGFFIEINPKQPLNLDIPLDRVKYNVIMASAAVSPNMRMSTDIKYKDAKYYITREFEEVGDRVAKRKKTMESSVALSELIKNQDRAVLVGRYLDLPVSNNMPNDNLLDIFQTYIADDVKLDSISNFLNAVSKTPEEISIKMLFSDAVKYRVVRQNDGLFQRGNITLGKNPNEAIAWLSNVANSGELMSIQEEVDLKRKYK